MVSKIQVSICQKAATVLWSYTTHSLSPSLAFLTPVNLLTFFLLPNRAYSLVLQCKKLSLHFQLRHVMDFLPCMTGASCTWFSAWKGGIRAMPRGHAEQQDSLAAEGLREAALPLPGWSRWNGFLETGNHLRGTFCLMFQLEEEFKKWLFTFKSWYKILSAMEQK